MDARTARLFAGLLAPGGLLDLRTDVERYAAMALRQLEEAGFVSEPTPNAGAPLCGEFPSTREKRYLATGQPVWRLRMRLP